MGLDSNEKLLADYNDVFADIMNVFLYDGEQVIGENDLENSKDRSIYKADGKLHEQERDVSKYYCGNEMRIAFLGVEHQNKSEPYMPLRVISYDGSSYRAQLLKNETEDEEARLKRKESRDKHLYPVITLVLYFGNGPWKHGKSLYEILKIPKRLKPFVNDYRINVIEVPMMDPEKVKLFKSDFRYVADFFVQKRMTGTYIPPDVTLKHMDEFLKLLGVMVGDERYYKILQELNEREKSKGGNATMCEILDQYWNSGIEIGEKRGIEKGSDALKDAIMAIKNGVNPSEIKEKYGQKIYESAESVVKVFV